MRLEGLGLRRNLAAVLLCTIIASLLWGGTAAITVDSLVTWRRPQDLTEEFLVGNSKPILMLIHKSWCGACTNLMGEINDPNKAKELIEMSKNFVMINAADADEPLDGTYSPDGKYIPRILFMSSDGKVLPEYKCKLQMNPTYHYFYSSASQVAYSMQHVWHSIAAKQKGTTETNTHQIVGLEDPLATSERFEEDSRNAE